MDKECCFIIARKGVSGGTGTLSLRIFEEIHKRGFNCVYFCNCNNAPSTYALIKDNTNTIVCESDVTYQQHFEKIKKKYKFFIFLTYSISEYMAINKLRDKNKSIKRVIYYVVHGYAFSLSPFVHVSRWRRMLFSFYNYVKNRRIVKELIANNSIIFMDETSVVETGKALRLKIPIDLIHLLPIKIKRYPESEWNGLKRHVPFTIGTMCRMEFPMKAYVIGLIDSFRKLVNDLNYDLRLIIVGDGPGEECLMASLDALPKEVRGRIEYIKNLPYSGIGDFYSQCDLALGMGTVLLDSANFNVLALPVAWYTNELKISNLFLYDVKTLSTNGTELRFEDVLKELQQLSNDDYNLLIKTQYERVRDLYNIEDFVNLLLFDTIGDRPVLFKDTLEYSFCDLIHKNI